MDIKKKEDELFDKWMAQDEIKCFIKDGCPSPDAYSKSELKIIFILKDANMGAKYILSNPGPYEQREELRTEPGAWWKKIRNWCVPILNPKIKWEQVKSKSVKESLAPFAFMQLKKAGGGGSVQNETLIDFARKYKEYIRAQIAIYQPDFIVCCGVGEIVFKEVFSETASSSMSTPNGVGYWTIRLNGLPDEKITHIIDFCHPSARFGEKAAGTVAFGLSQAINFLKNQSAE